MAGKVIIIDFDDESRKALSGKLSSDYEVCEVGSTQEAAMLLSNISGNSSLRAPYNRETFFIKAAEMIASKESGYYVMASFDINNFKFINDQYGNEKGDEVLEYTANIFRNGFEALGGIYCRITGDKFAVMYPSSYMDSEEVAEIRKKASVLDGSIPPVSFSIGRYVVNDKALTVSAMYDRASIAEATVKGRFDEHIAYYDESMRESIVRRQEIIDDMKGALESGQFEVWLQPQYNHSSGAVIGAEALVRWIHPQRGMISPGTFIPIFEQNGFIYELDKYIWEKTCTLLEKWIKQGRSPLPVSVNISRYDIFRDDMVQTLCGTLERHSIPVELLRLEITESAFAKSTAQIISVVKKLVDYGFTVEIDDFGSGYSSLNTLKDVPAHIIKLDMHFLESEEQSDRAGNIIESIVRMVKWLGMSIIAEGVETAQQAEYLKSIGCSYVQGYLYARPMCAGDYEKLAKTVTKEEKMITLETVTNLNNNSFWNPDSIDSLIFNSYVGGACIFEYCNSKVELLRATEKYARLIGSKTMSSEDVLKLVWADYIDAENAELVAEAIRISAETHDEVTQEFVFNNLPGCPEKTYLRSTLRVIGSVGDRYLIYCTNENITAQRNAEKQSLEVSEKLQAIMDNAGCGITATVVKGEDVHFLFSNDKFYSMLGCTRKQFIEYGMHVFDFIHTEDRRRVIASINNANKTWGQMDIEFRAARADSSEIYLRAIVSITHFDGVKDPVQLCVFSDITSEKKSQIQVDSLNDNLRALMNDTPGGFARMRLELDGSIRTEYVNGRFCELRGMSYEEILESDSKDAMHSVHPDDVDALRDEIRRMLATGTTGSIKYRLRHKSGKYIWLIVFGRITHSAAGGVYINAYYADPSENEKKGLFEYSTATLSAKQIYQDVLTSSMPLGVFIFRLSDNELLHIGGSLLESFGYSNDEFYLLHENCLRGFVLEDDYGTAFTDIRMMEGEYPPFYEQEFRIVKKDGGIAWLYEKATLVVIDGKQSYIVIMLDITNSKETAEKLRVHDEELKLIFSRMGKIICEYDIHTRTLTMPAEYARLHGLPAVLKNVPEVLHDFGDIPFEDFYNSIINGEKVVSMEAHGPCVDGAVHWERAEAITIFDSFGKPAKAIIAIDDITQHHSAQTQISEMRSREDVLRRAAEIDGMTGIYNRTAALQLINERLNTAKNTPCTLIIADLDNLKSINDTFGHDCGDKAIQCMANALKAQFRRTDIIGRIGGDEFIVFLSGNNEARLRSLLTSFMRRLSDETVPGCPGITLHSSVGAVIGLSGDGYSELFKRADRALYQVKRNGKDNFAVYTADMEQDTYRYVRNNELSIWQSNYFDTEELNHLLGAISAFYSMVISVNLTQNTYYMLQYDNYMTRKCFSSGNFNELITQGAQTFVPGDSDEFIKLFSRDSLIRAYERGEKIVTHVGRQLGDDGIYRLISTDVVFVKGTNGDLLEITLAREVSTQLGQG